MTASPAGQLSILIRVDASPRIGGGHFMRCLTLADALTAQGASVTFAVPDLLRWVAARLDEVGHRRIAVPGAVAANAPEGWDRQPLPLDSQRADAERIVSLAGESRFDWVLVDHYGFDAVWEKAVRPVCERIAVIDDLANRAHDCDFLLDQTFGRPATDYRQLVPEACSVLTGSRFALLRPEFARERPASLARRQAGGPVARLLISLGSTDVGGLTARVAEAAARLATSCEIDVVLGANAKSLPRVEALCARQPRVRLHVDVRDMARLIAGADLAIGAAGATSWERGCLGVPSIAFTLAANQSFIAQQLERAGAHLAVSEGEENDLERTLTRLLDDPGARWRMSEAAAAVTDGLGVNRVTPVFTRRAGAVGVNE
jgi:UDP-2,4-diacetamido-2,4,6-trideoxy-beta-L-altropyranose hydrolase